MKTLLFVICALVVVCLSAFPARAAVYIVTNSDNGGAGSLRAAIDAANSTADDDIINFNIPGCENGGCTIAFAGLFGTAVLQIQQAGKLTIANNPGANNISISGNDIDRVFQLSSGADLTLIGITVTDGNSDHAVIPNIGGGGIYNNGGAVTLINSVIANNHSGAGGAGIDTTDGTLTLTNSTISNNTAGNGPAGIGSTGTTINITNSFVTGNTSATTGGGLAYAAGNVSITGSVFSHNRATAGGGILVGGESETATLTVTGSTINNNVAASGAGIYNGAGTVTITGSTIDSNTYDEESGFGGGIYTNGGTLSLINSTVSRNHAGIIGGGIANLGEIAIVNSSIVRNVAASNTAGGIFNASVMSARNSIIAENVGKDNPDINSSAAGFTSKGNNLIGSTLGSDVAWLPSDIIDQPARLGPVGNYGGKVPTAALTNLSPAINNGNDCVVTVNGCGDNNPALASISVVRSGSMRSTSARSKETTRSPADSIAP